MTTNYIPKQWRAEDGQIFGPNPCGDGEILIADTAPGDVALTEYDEPHARLIAAAPDLLAACEAALNGTPFNESYRDLCRAAIAKARGETTGSAPAPKPERITGSENITWVLPLWACKTLRQTIEMDIKSKAIDSDTRQEIREAYEQIETL